MTGLIDRVRAWIGSLLGGDDADGADADDANADGADADGATTTDPTVVHRDDRPLETPGTMSPADARPPEATPTGDADRPRTAETTTAEPPTGGDDPEDPAVSIPDAEAVADGTAETAATDGTAETAATDADSKRAGAAEEAAIADADETGTPSTAVEAGTDRRARSDSDTAADGESVDTEGETFVCSVCGTTVDDPAADCPLCRSTDVVPVAAAETGDETARSGRTTVSSTAEEDEAVDRLRDVQDGSGRAD